MGVKIVRENDALEILESMIDKTESAEEQCALMMACKLIRDKIKEIN